MEDLASQRSGDGLADRDEECPEEAGAASSFGCPDGDEDGVPDYRDECPEEKAPEGANKIRSKGCDTVAYVADGALVIAEKVEFDSGKATIKSSSHELLDTVAGLLNAYKGIKKVQVQGHTDSDGDDDAGDSCANGKRKRVDDAVGDGNTDAGVDVDSD